MTVDKKHPSPYEEEQAYPRTAWKLAVNNNTTHKGYWEWVGEQKQTEYLMVPTPINMFVYVKGGVIEETNLTDGAGVEIPFTLELADADDLRERLDIEELAEETEDE